MKWIVVILVLLNLSAWLIGKKVDPDALQGVSGDQVKTINAAAMSVVQPALEMAKRKESEIAALEEESLAQLKLDKRGQVLMAPSKSKADGNAPSNADSSSPAHKAIVETPEPAEIVALDRSKPKMAAAPAQKPTKLKQVAVPEPTPEVAARATLKCYRLGPFDNQNSLASVRRTLERNGIGYAVDQRGAAKKIKAVRIYLGAYASTAALQAEVKRLKQMKIEHYVITLNGTPVIQLGYFSEPARATAFQKTLRSKDIEAKADTIYHEAKIDSWLNVQQASKKSMSQLKLPGGAQVKERACR